MIKKIHVLSAITLMSVFITSSVYCADWLNFFESSEGNRHYIDLESISRSHEGIVSVKRKIEFKGSSELDYVISAFEMDCNQGKMRKMSEKAFKQHAPSSSTMSKSEWLAVTPEGLDESLYELACSLQKKRSR